MTALRLPLGPVTSINKFKGHTCVEVPETKVLSGFWREGAGENLIQSFGENSNLELIFNSDLSGLITV